MIISEEVNKGDTVVVNVRKGEFAFAVKSKAAVKA